MYLLALIILIITGLVSIVDIIKDLGESVSLLVKTSQALFFLSLLFFVIKSSVKKKD
ncbi:MULTISPECIES: hypothetical protein [Paenibacillus]|uniref:hypothetical protein n=1 Tax=Paenibacillus TaxID=44249 RepID=UPI001643F091|nr:MULTISPECIES: hypothetical protein [Paenibacillus]MBJ9989284.1 hypothetical protein [Paenibacillus sp. S28]